MADLGDSIGTGNADWSFGGEVSENFDSHVERSVPMYHQGHELIVQAADFFLSDGSLCYELGCSTGALLKKLAERNADKGVQFIGIDTEAGMVKQAREKCRGLEQVEILQADLLDLKLDKADAIVSYYTLQFVKPRDRQIAFDRIYQALNWGGAFFCFEKVRAPDARFQDMMTALYNEYKISQGYDAEQILGKSRRLKGVLEPFSSAGNLDLMRRAGFVDIMTILKYVCFEGFLAIK